MKGSCFKFLVWLIVLHGNIGVQAGMREFKLLDGRTLTAEIVGYNSKLGKVELKRKDGKRIPVKPTVFVEEDQKYIQGWAMLDGVRNERFFKMSCKKDLVEKWKDEKEENVNYGDGATGKETISISRFERYVFEVDLENRNEFALKNLKVEYRIFYEQEATSGSGKIIAEKKVLSGSMDVEQIALRGKKKLTTKPVVLRDTQYASDITFSGIKRERESGEIKGIWLRVMASELDGQTVMREVFEPSSLAGKYNWSEK